MIYQSDCLDPFYRMSNFTIVLRGVWAAITRHPRSSYRELAAMIGISPATVARAVHCLAASGYIRYTENHARSLSVVEPFVIEGDLFRWYQAERKRWYVRYHPTRSTACTI